jgi:hypothetical protein
VAGINRELPEVLRDMSDTEPTIEVTHDQPKPRAATAKAPAAPADPAPAPTEIITTITLKPGCKITIEYPS